MEPGGPPHIRLLCLDVDGVLTDGSICIDDHGVEMKRFHVRDGAGIRLWRRLGLEIAVITAREGMAVRHRIRELGIPYLVQGARNKAEAFGSLLSDLHLKASQAAMVGDDLPDLPVLRICGYPVAVADAVADVRAVASFTTIRPGGHGAVRETIEHLLKGMDRWEEALALYE